MTFDTHALMIPAEGHDEAGDTYVVRLDDSGALRMVAVIDVLGHGTAAAVVARQAADELRAASIASAETIMNDLHAALKGTRGAAAMICVFESRSMQACGVGNVDMRAGGSRIPVVLSPGIVGGRVRKLRTFEAELIPGTRMVIHSDGVSSRFDVNDYSRLTASATCESIMEKYRRPHDDATVLVVDVS